MHSGTTMPVVAMSTLGRNGRFGNQLIQYAFLRIYARRYGLRLLTPEWVGQYLFGHHDEPVGQICLPMFYDDAWNTTVLDRLPQPMVNVDVCGYFHYHTSYYAPEQQFFRELFRPVEQIRKPLDQAVAKLRKGGRTLIGIHLRRGDFGQGCHFVAPCNWYRTWLEQHWRRWEKPILYLASDEPEKVAADFAEFRPVLMADLGVDIPQAPFYPDFYALQHCDALGISNSSFSFVASMLNERGHTFVRASLKQQKLVSYDPWSSHPMLTDLGVESDDFYPKVNSEVVAAANAYTSNPHSPEAVQEMQKKRRYLADLWLGMNDDTLLLAYNILGSAQRVCSTGEPRKLPVALDEREYVKKIIDGLKSGLDGVWARQYLLAAMLYCQPWELPMRHDLALVPQWLIADYLSYLRLPQDVPPQRGTVVDLGEAPMVEPGVLGSENLGQELPKAL